MGRCIQIANAYVVKMYTKDGCDKNARQVKASDYGKLEIQFKNISIVHLISDYYLMGGSICKTLKRHLLQTHFAHFKTLYR